MKLTMNYKDYINFWGSCGSVGGASHPMIKVTCRSVFRQDTEPSIVSHGFLGNGHKCPSSLTVQQHRMLSKLGKTGMFSTPTQHLLHRQTPPCSSLLIEEAAWTENMGELFIPFNLWHLMHLIGVSRVERSGVSNLMRFYMIFNGE